MAANRISLPTGAAIGLDLFAAAWLERWNSYGGSITLELTSDRMWSFLAEDGHTDGWEAARHVGATRELLELLRLVPGGRDAVKAHVALFPSARGGGVVQS
jgi:hypothetical protein